MPNDDRLELSDVADLKGGFAFKSEDYVPDGHFVLRTVNIRDDGRISRDGAVFIDEREVSQYARFALEPDDTLFVMVGATLGKVGYVKAVDLPALLNQNMWVVRPKDRKFTHPRFLNYWFQWTVGQTLQWQSGSARGFVRRDDYRQLPFPRFGYYEQKEIAGVLGSLDDKIEQNRRTGRKLEALARAVFKAWFVDFEPVKAKAAGATAFPGMPPETFATLPTRLVDSELGPVPEGWEIATLARLANIAIGGVWGEDAPAEGLIEAISLRGVDLEHLRDTGSAKPPRRWIKMNAVDKRSLAETDVLIAASGAGPIGRPLWAHPSLLSQWQTPVTYSNFCKKLACPSSAAACFVDSLLHEMRLSRETWEHVNGTSIPNLDAGSLLSKPLVVPPKLILDAYHGIVHPMVGLRYSGESRRLATLRDYLLPRLLSGRVRVRDAERATAQAE